mmetsp:Transcript_13634/g.21347  ORF Transcript_13634/g.21347 Transcript_13634/m.21347 type:complete len:183 (+) Transcript_13634:1333-1881(+)
MAEWSSILPNEDHYTLKKSFNRSILKDELSQELFAMITSLVQDEIRFCHECQYNFVQAVQKQQKRVIMIKMFSVIILIIILLFVLLVSFSKDVPLPPAQCSLDEHLFYTNGLPCPIAKDDYTLAKPCNSISGMPGGTRHTIGCSCPDYFKHDPTIDHFCIQPRCKEGEALSVEGECHEMPFY